MKLWKRYIEWRKRRKYIKIWAQMKKANPELQKYENGIFADLSHTLTIDVQYDREKEKEKEQERKKHNERS